MKPRIQALLFLLVVLATVPARSLHAQFSRNATQAVAAYFDVPEALLKAGVKQARCLYRDSRGFLWIGTYNGLYRFDGSHVVYLRHILNDTATIPDNTVNNITEDAAGRIWVGTNGGVGCLNAYNLSCKIYNLLNQRLNDIFDCRVVADRQGNIWCGNIGGVYRFDAGKRAFVRIWSSNLTTFPAATHVICVSDYGRDSLVFSTYTHLVFLSKQHYGSRVMAMKDISPSKTVFITKIYQDADSNIWFATWKDGVLRYNRRSGAFFPYRIQVKGAAPVIFTITSTYENGRQYLWLGLPGGLFKIVLDDRMQVMQNESMLYRGQNSNAMLESRNVVDLLPDSSGNLWIADVSVQYFNSAAGAFKEILSAGGNMQDLQRLVVKGRPYYFLSTWYQKKGLYIFDGGFHIIKSIAFPLGGQQDDNVSGVAQDRFGRLWVSTLSGVYILDQQFRIISRLAASGPDSLSSSATNGISIIHDTVWVACYKRGIDLFDLQLHSIRRFSKGDRSGLPEDLFSRFYADSNGNTWVCGDNILYRFEPRTARFVPYLLTQEGRGCGPREIAERSDHTFVIASDHGLIHFNPVTGKYAYPNTPLLFNEESAYSLCLDNKGDVWYLTGEHLVNYSFRDRQFHVYGKEDGLNVNRDFYLIRQFAGVPMVIAQQGQLVTVDVAQLHQHTERPGITITHINVNDSAYNFSSPVKDLMLSYAQNKLYFEFTGINFQKAYQNIYAYRLDGVDKAWTYTSQNIASYANLSPGKYRFQVRVKNYAGFWSDVYPVDITIQPPFWRQWWFIMLAASFAFAVVYMIYRYQLRQALRIEQLRNKISADLHDDIGSTLSSISILTDIAIKEENREHSLQMISEVKDTSISLMEKMDDIVWSINPENDHLEDIFLRIRRFASKVLEAKDIRFEITMNQEVRDAIIPMDYRQHIYMILKEGINNCVKYSRCDYVKLDLQFHEHFLDISLWDNGIGFDLHRVQRGNGLLNMQQRAALLKSKLVIESAQGAGTMIRLRVKIL